MFIELSANGKSDKNVREKRATIIYNDIFQHNPENYQDTVSHTQNVYQNLYFNIVQSEIAFLKIDSINHPNKLDNFPLLIFPL